MRSATAPRPSGSSSAPASPDGAAGFGLYVHWPFCLSKCPYCDFNSHVRAAIDEAAWRQGLLAELDWFAARVGPRPLASIFFGGGTPSLMAPDTVAALVARARQRFAAAPDLEVTLEANPSSVEAGRFRAFRDAGVNRLSLGVQSFRDERLRFLGRQHDAAAAQAALDIARATFPRVSIDLIYALPGQAEAEWRADLARALALGLSHLSLYQLTIEPNTGFAGAHARGEFVLPDEDAQSRLYDLTGEMTAEAGLSAYEISNHASPGQESRHNLVYWRYGDYIGIGPGAHGRFHDTEGKRASRQWRKPEAWLACVRERGHGTEAEEQVPVEAQIEEMLMMGLRLAEGVELGRLERLAGRPFDEVLSPARLARLEKGGFLRRRDGRLHATEAGRRLLNTVLAELL
ncbi:MAG: coproporphyrinogen III oxidase [Alphaproteobacteria bacterium]|nr:coproporphyrinogen III oxidase [Alphaproteobacteria bacterium]